jgi:hypothetical protein
MTEYPEHLEHRRSIIREVAVKVSRIMEIQDELYKVAVETGDEIEAGTFSFETLDDDRCTAFIDQWVEFEMLTRSVAGAMAVCNSDMHPLRPQPSSLLNQWAYEMLTIETREGE